MVSSGMTILRALFVLEEQTEVKKLKAVIVTVRKDVEAGLAFSVALGRHPKVFSPLFVSMVRAGEIGGVLEDSLMRIADQLEKEDALRRQVRSAMVYPSVVLTVALVVMIVLVVYIVPVFAGVLKQFATNASRRVAAGDDPGHRRLLPRDDRLLVRLHPRRRRRSPTPSAAGRARRAGGRSGTRSA